MTSLFCVNFRHGRHLETMTSCRRSDSVNSAKFHPDRIWNNGTRP